MVNVSRLKLDHPALGTPGGSGLHAAVNALYEKIGDAISDRYFALTDFDSAETEDLDHNFNTDITNLRWDLYNFIGGEWVLLTESTTPKRSEMTFAEKSGFENTVLELTNGSASNDLTLAVVLKNDPVYLREGDVKDVDVSTVAPEDGQALVYEASSAKFKPGASGDASFKLQSIAANEATIKAGSIFLNDGKELYLAADTTLNLKTQVNALGVTAPGASTPYYAYLDLQALPAQTSVGNSQRKVYAASFGTSGMLVILATTPENINTSRYVPLYSLKTDGSSNYTEYQNLSVRRHAVAPISVSPIVETIGPRSIGAVGAVANARGALVDGDITFASSAYFPLTSLANSASQGGALSDTGSVPFSGIGFFGRENVVNLDGSTQFLSSSNAFFNPGNVNFSAGIWYRKAPNNGTDNNIISQSAGGSDRGFGIVHTVTDTLIFRGSITTTFVDVVTVNIAAIPVGQWVHIVFTYTASGNIISAYINGLLAGSASLGGNQRVVTAPSFSIGVGTPGLFQDFYFTQSLQTAAQIKALYSKRFTNNAQIAAGHALTADSFPFTSLTARAYFWNLNNALTDGSGNAKTLTNVASVPFTGLGLFGQADVPELNGTTQYLSSADAALAVGDFDYAWGGWFRAAWGAGSYGLISQQSTDSTGAFIRATTVDLDFRVAIAATLEGILIPLASAGISQAGAWYHIAGAIKGRVMYLYVNGVQVASKILSAAPDAHQSVLQFGARRSTSTADFFKGNISQAFFIKGAVSDADIRKLASARIDLSNTSVLAVNQKWAAYHESEDGKVVNEYDTGWLVDKKADKIYVDFGGASGNKVTLRLSDLSISARQIAARTFRKVYTSTPPSSVAHLLAENPTGFAVLHDELADGKYAPLPVSNHIKSDSTNLYLAGFGSLLIDATHPLEIVASIAPIAVAVSKKSLDNLKPEFTAVASNITATDGDQLLLQTGVTVITLPATPAVGTRVTLMDGGIGLAANNVTVGRNGQLINGTASDLVLDVDNSRSEFVFAGGARGWQVY